MRKEHAYVTLDACNKELVNISLRVLDEIWRSLLRGDGNEGHTFVGGLEPNDLWTLNSTARFISTIAFALATFGLLLFLCSSRGRTEKSESARKQLTGHSLDNCHNMASELGLNFIGDSE
jgi:hypothetical protein